MKIYAPSFAGKTVIVRDVINNGKLSFDEKGYSEEFESSENSYVDEVASILEGVVVDTPAGLTPVEEPAEEVIEVKLTKIEEPKPRKRSK